MSPDSLVYVTIQNISKPNFEVYVLVNINPGIERDLHEKCPVCVYRGLLTPPLWLEEKRSGCFLLAESEALPKLIFILVEDYAN